MPPLTLTVIVEKDQRYRQDCTISHPRNDRLEGNWELAVCWIEENGGWDL